MYLHVASSLLLVLSKFDTAVHCIPEWCGACSAAGGGFSCPNAVESCAACRRRLLTGFHCCRLAVVVVCFIIPIRGSSCLSRNTATMPFVYAARASSTLIKAVPSVYLGPNLSLSDYDALARLAGAMGSLRWPSSAWLAQDKRSLSCNWRWR
jgi:hypothetical protein